MRISIVKGFGKMVSESDIENLMEQKINKRKNQNKKTEINISNPIQNMQMMD